MTAEGINRRQAMRGVAVAGLGVPLLAACGEDEPVTDSANDPAPADETPTAGGDGGVIAKTSDIPEGGGKVVGEVVITQPAAGDFKAFSSSCTHRQCAVTKVDKTILCPCHASEFSIEDGSNVTGPGGTDPTLDALAAVEIKVEGDSISLA